MAIDYETTRSKVNDLNRSAIKIVDMINVIEDGAVQGEILTAAQLGRLVVRLKSEADNLTAIAGEVKKTLVG